MSNKAPRGERLAISLVGRRNAGKSSLVNALTGQETAIVSETPGTTTDPVVKHYELLPLGPVTFHDTAGLDDEGDLGSLRMRATRRVLWRTDVALLVLGEHGLGSAEKAIAEDLGEHRIPCIAVFNKSDTATAQAEAKLWFEKRNIPSFEVSATQGTGIDELKRGIIRTAPAELRKDPVLVRDLIHPEDTVLCVVPIDMAAPKGRLILPQVQVLRDCLDADAVGMVVKEHQLGTSLGSLRTPPALVVTDSQVIDQVCNAVPDSIPLTTFSILFARHKGDLRILADGAAAIGSLRDGDRILMAEACSHHATDDDIGRVKIPGWLRRRTGLHLEFDHCRGHDFPDDLEKYALCIHCGSCMTNRSEMLRRLRECTRRGVPITNYGIAISLLQGVLDRVLEPFAGELRQ